VASAHCCFHCPSVNIEKARLLPSVINKDQYKAPNAKQVALMQRGPSMQQKKTTPQLAFLRVCACFLKKLP
jgi:hypothetical protein